MSTDPVVWKPPPAHVILPYNELHIWLADLDNSWAAAWEWERVLNEEERAQADRLRFDQDQKRFVTARGVLRTIIGQYYLGMEPSLVEFYFGTRGKPFVKGYPEKMSFQFNSSHSRSFALYGFIQEYAIGVDIEYIRAIQEAASIIDGNCSEREKTSYHSLPEHERLSAFFNCWTRKESFIKAIGEGLYYPLDKFDVSLRPDAPAKILSIDKSSSEAARWTLMDINPLEGFLGAAAVRGQVENIIFFEFPHLSKDT